MSVHGDVSNGDVSVHFTFAPLPARGREPSLLRLLAECHASIVAPFAHTADCLRAIGGAWRPWGRQLVHLAPSHRPSAINTGLASREAPRSGRDSLEYLTPRYSMPA